MDSFDVSNVKAEKMNAMLRYRRLRKIANLFRCFEICMALILLSWFSTRLPIAVKNSGHYFREFCEILVSPRFVFLLGNAIILTLFAKSGHFFSHGFNNPNPSATDSLYDEFVKNNHDNIHTRQKSQSNKPSLAMGMAMAPPEEELAYENKDTMHEQGEVKTLTLSHPDEHVNSSNPKIVFRRTQSENLKLKLKSASEAKEKPRQKLRRSETEICRKVGRDTEQQAEEEEIVYTEDNMSNEEFQRKVEAFIAKQQKFQREEESMDMVLQNLKY